MNRINAACGYCGQFVNLEFETNQRKAQDRAILMCDCPEAKAYQKQEEDKRRAALKREETLVKSISVIDSKFGKEITDDELHQMPEAVVSFLKDVCILVYDCVIGGTTINLPHGCRAKISMNAKSNLSIERKDTIASKEEI